MAEFVVELERDEDGKTWLARVPAVPGCHTYGRSIDQAMNRIRDALGLWIPKSVAERADLIRRVELPQEAKADLRRWILARDKARRAQEEASQILAETVRDLTADAGWSFRDVAKVVELSPQRVQQVAAKGQGTKVAGRKVAARKSAARRRAGKKR